MDRSSTPGYRYDAFISYSRADQAFAKALEARLERYRAPKGTHRSDGQALPRRRLTIFRDMYDLGGTHLSQELEEEIKASRHLIVICSPDSSRDGNGWIGKEIEWYARHHGEHGHVLKDGIIPVLLQGRPNHEVHAGEPQDQAFHRTLYTYLADPLAVDFRSFPKEPFWQRRERRREAFLHLLAILFETSKEELARRQQHRARLRSGMVIAFLLAVAVGLAGLASFAFSQRDAAQRSQAAETEARQEAEQRLVALCKALDEAQILADTTNQGSVYYFQREYYIIREECSMVDYQAWQ